MRRRSYVRPVRQLTASPCMPVSEAGMQFGDKVWTLTVKRRWVVGVNSRVRTQYTRVPIMRGVR